METHEIIASIIEAHETDDASGINLTRNVILRPQLNYSGLMAVLAYENWRELKNANRPFCGILDFKIINKDVDTEHERDMIKPAVCDLSIEDIRLIHNGYNPLELKGYSEKVIDDACCIQAAFIEQELNWGEEDFQIWSHFGNHRSRDALLSMSAPRDFQMVFIERCSAELNSGKSWDEISTSIIARFTNQSSATRSDRIKPPLYKGMILDDFRDYMPPKINQRRTHKWINSHLDRISNLCQSKGVNPRYAKKFLSIQK